MAKKPKKPPVDKNLARLLASRSPGWLMRRLGVGIETLKKWGRGQPSASGRRALAELAAEERARARRPKRPAPSKKKPPRRRPPRKPPRRPPPRKPPKKPPRRPRRPPVERISIEDQARGIGTTPEALQLALRLAKKRRQPLTDALIAEAEAHLLHPTPPGMQPVGKLTKTFPKWVHKVGAEVAAQVLGKTPAEIKQYMAVGVPPAEAAAIRAAIKKHNAAARATRRQQDKGIRAARKKVKEPPVSFRKLAQIEPFEEFTKDSWARALRGFMEARAEVFRGREFGRGSPYLRRVTERGPRGRAVDFYRQVVNVEEFALKLNLAQLVDIVHDKALSMIARLRASPSAVAARGEGDIIVKFTVGLNCWGNPFYLSILALGNALEPPGTYVLHAANILNTWTDKPGWESTLHRRIRSLVVGPITEGPENNAIAEIMAKAPLLFIENAEIVFEPKKTPTSYRQPWHRKG